MAELGASRMTTDTKCLGAGCTDQGCPAHYANDYPTTPEVAKLVEALEAVVSYHTEVKPNDVNLMMHYSEMLSKVRAALATYRKGGDL